MSRIPVQPAVVEGDAVGAELWKWQLPQIHTCEYSLQKRLLSLKLTTGNFTKPHLLSGTLG